MCFVNTVRIDFHCDVTIILKVYGILAHPLINSVAF